MSIIATISGSSRQVQRNVSVSWRLGGRGTADVIVYDPESAPQVGEPIRIFEDGVNIWSGSIDDIEKTIGVAPGVATYQYRMRCVSQEYRLSYRLVKPAVAPSDPSSTYTALSGVVNVGGSTVIWVSGDKFDLNLEKTKITVGGLPYTVASVEDSEHLTLATSAGSGVGIAYTWTPYAGNIVKSILHHWLIGETLTAGTIEDGDDVGKQIYDYASVSDIFDRLAEASDSIWYVDAEGNLCFHARTTVTAGTDLESALVFLVDQPSVTQTRAELCNARYQRISYNAFDADAATVPGDGTSKEFWIGSPIALITQGSIQIGGQFFVATFGVRDVDTGKDFYYSPGENKLTQDASYSGTIIGATNESPIVVQTAAAHGRVEGQLVYIGGVIGNTAANGWFRVNVPDDDHLELIDSEGNGDYVSGGSIECNQALDPGDYLRFNFRRLGSDVVGYADDDAISARGAIEGTSGRYERIEETTDSVDSTGALNLATAVVNAKKNTAVQIKAVTTQTGYRPGQLVNVDLPDFGINSEFLIEEISARDQEDGAFRYSLSLVDGQVIGGWRQVFEALRGTSKASALSIIAAGGSASGSAPGTPGGSFAPNVSAATVSAVFGVASNESAFGIQGSITLPGDLSHLAGIDVEITRADGSKDFAVPTLTPSGSSISFVGDVKYLQSYTADESITVTFLCKDETGLYVDSPLTKTLVIHQAKITSITSPREIPGDKIVDPLDRLPSTRIGATPVFNSGQVPQCVTYWVSDYYDATKWTWIGFQVVDAVGTEVSFYRIIPATDKTWKIAMCVGPHGGDAATPIDTADLPAGTVISSGFTVPKLGPPSNNVITSLTVAPGAGGTYPYNVTEPSGRKYWSIPYVEYNDTSAAANPSVFFVRITAQAVDSAGHAIGPEKPFAGASVSEAEHVRRWGPLMGNYGNSDSDGPLTYLGSPANIAAIRFRVYTINRIPQDSYSFADTNNGTVQQINGSATYLDVTVASGGAVPSSALGVVASAGNVTGLTVTSGYVYRNGKYVRQIYVSYGEPGSPDTYDAGHVYYEEPDQSATGQLIADGTAAWDGSTALGSSGMTATSGPIAKAGTVQPIVIDNLEPLSNPINVRVYLASINTAGKENALVRNGRPGATPSVVVTCPAMPQGNGPLGADYAANAAGFAAKNGDGVYTNGVKLSHQEGGDWLYGLGVQWNAMDLAAHPEVGGFDLVIQYSDGRRELATSPSVNDTPQWHSDSWPLQNGGTNFILWLVSWNTDGRRNSIIPGITPSVSIAVSRPGSTAGSDYTSLVSGLSASITTGYDADGGELWGFKVNWSNPGGDPTFGGGKVEAVNTASGDIVELGNPGPDDQSLTTDQWPLKDSITWKIRFRSRSNNNQLNPYVSGTTPEVTGLTVTSAGGKLKINRVDTSTFNTAEFQIDPIDNKWKAVQFDANKIFVGSILRVGGGNIANTTAPSFAGSNGQIAVYNASNQLRAWMGQNGAVYGGWFGELYIGGTGPGDAPLYANNAGVVVIGGVGGGTPFVSLRNSSNTEVGRMGANIDGGSLQGAWFQSLLIAPSMASTSPRIQLSGSTMVIEGATFNLHQNNTTVTINNASDPVLADFIGVSIATDTAADSLRHASKLSSSQVALTAFNTGTGVQQTFAKMHVESSTPNGRILLTNSGNSGSAEMSATALGPYVRVIDSSGARCFLTGSSLSLNNAQVLGPRRTGWTLATGARSRASFDPNFVSVVTLAQVVAALIDDLHVSSGGHGLIG
jgi:hypothetical protein